MRTEELDAVVSSGVDVSTLYKTVILEGEAAEAVRNAYTNALDKYHVRICVVRLCYASIGAVHRVCRC
jgi:hypothetical protein